MEPLTSLSELRRLLRWNNVTEYELTQGWRVFAIWPSRKLLPPIEFLFDDRVTMLQQLSFGPWHGHYDGFSNERKNVLKAMICTRSLIRGSRCLLIERDSEGSYLGSSILRRGEVPRHLSRDFSSLEQLAFDAKPEQVQIDLAGFYRTKNGSYIDHALRQDMKNAFPDMALKTGWWD